MPAPVAPALTAQDITALTAANSVTFLFDAITDSAVARAATLWCAEGDEYAEALFPEHDECRRRVRNIGCGVAITGYHTVFRHDLDWTERDAINTVCGARVLRKNPFWSTVLKLLQPGDRLTQHWFADTRNDPLHEAGLTADELVIRIERDESQLQFQLLTHATTPDDASRLVVRGTEAHAVEVPSTTPHGTPIRDRPKETLCATG